MHHPAPPLPRPRVSFGLFVACVALGCSCEKKTTTRKHGSAEQSPVHPSMQATAQVDPIRPLEQPACPTFLAGRKQGRINNEALTEASGLAASRKNPGVLWSHNDSGGEPRLFAMTQTGADLGTYHLAKAKLEDWEDIAIAPAEQPNQWHIYVGDIGTNAKSRHRISVYRALEPDVELGQEPKKHKLKDVTRFEFTYPDHDVHDAETLMVDPRSLDLYIVTKPRTLSPKVYRAKAPLDPDHSMVLEEVATLTEFERGSLRSTLVTAGDISPDGSQILIRTYTKAFLWVRLPNETVADSLKRTPCPVPLSREPQGETLAFSAEGNAYYTVSEGQEPKLFRFERQR